MQLGFTYVRHILPSHVTAGGCISLQCSIKHVLLQGVGVRWQTTIGTLEVNFCQVLAHQQHDRPRIGLQFGVIPMS